MPSSERGSVILGIWDGHDAGAAVLAGGRLVTASNEERFTRRKLEIKFPLRSIASCLRDAGLAPGDVTTVAVSTSDLAKTLGRLAPWTKEEYYRVRRRQGAPGRLAPLTRAFKYRLTEFGPSGVSRALSRRVLRRELVGAGIAVRDIRLFDHHACHAAGAAFASPFDACVVVTIDGLGDGASATVSRFERGVLRRLATTPASSSLGVFFEHVTTLLNMRELEDEGKVMALADYAAPVPDERNPLLELVRVDGLEIRTAVTGAGWRKVLAPILWRHPSEQFAAMAQRVVERTCVALVRAACRATGLPQVALAGGVVSNVKANRLIRLLEEVDDVFVFPHMGDGGLAIGAAGLAWVGSEGGTQPHLDLQGMRLGPQFTEDEMRAALTAAGVAFTQPESRAAAVADLIAADRVVMWFDGRMELGPRALGGRSVLARPDRGDISRRLNLVLKRRVWYQPFCPSLLESDARALFDDWTGTPDRYMTMAYRVREERRALTAGVTSVDGTCRPQIVPDDDRGVFADLLRELRPRLGAGMVLNTSFNIHGEPLVCTPAEAVATYLRSGADALQLGPFLTCRD